MIIEFDKASHTYAVDGELANLSVTELLHKHKLAPDYSGVDKATLTKKASKGTETHGDLENIVNDKDNTYKPKTLEGFNFKAWANENCFGATAEQKLAIEFCKVIIAGSCDIMGYLKNGETFIADHKTTASINKNYVSWQVSLLDYMAKKFVGGNINGKPFKWKGADHFYCFHYNKDGELKLVELEKVADADIEELLKAEYRGEIYKPKQLIIEKDLATEIEELELDMAIKKAEYDLIKAKCDEKRAQLLKLCEEQKISAWETEDKEFKFAYIPKQTVLSVDSTLLKREYPLIYTKVLKETTKSAYLKVSRAKSNDNS